MTTLDAISCLSKADDDANKELAEKYSAVSKVVSEVNLKDALDRSQQTWTTYIHQTCQDLIEPFWQGGTIQQPAYMSCVVRLTRQRTRDLDELFYSPLHN